MKKIKLLVVLALIANNIYAQKNNVQSAANMLKDNKIEEAKTYIDKAAENSQTANYFKMWYYRGQIYLAIYAYKKFSYLDDGAIEKSTTSFINCLKTDSKGWYVDEVSDKLIDCAIGLYNKAADAVSNNESDKAIRLYNKIFEIIPYDKNKALVRQNISEEILYNNCYLAAWRTKDYSTARTYLQKLIDMNYNDPIIYLDMSKTFLQEKDTAKALSYIEQGRNIFDDYADLLALELDIYYAQGKKKELITKLTKALENDPENELLHYSRGTFYEKTEEWNKAEADYKKAIEINPDYFDAQYNLGILYFNSGVEIIKKANEIKDNAKYQAEKNKADEKFKQAIPYLEKAHKIDSEDKNTMTSLKLLYARMGMTEKFDEMNQKINN